MNVDAPIQPILSPADQLAIEFRDRLAALLGRGYFGCLTFAVIIKAGHIDHIRVTPEQVLKSSDLAASGLLRSNGKP